MTKKIFIWMSLVFIFCGVGQAAGEDMEPVVNAPEFPSDIEWLNTDKPLSLAALRGKYVLLDFWTYACINCMHILPDLERLESEFPTKLIVIGVHSAKFKNEKDSRQITKAIERNGIHHPVVNDSQFQIWDSYAVKAWPTIVIVNPEGKIIFTRSGEGVYDSVKPFLNKLIKDDVTDAESRIKEALPVEILKYPGKIIVDVNRIYISDSGRNRILVTDLDGKIIETIGNDEAGNKEGSFSETRFNEPLGLAIKGEKLFVADRKNHTIKCCNLSTKSCESFVGSGKQGKTFNVSGIGNNVSLNSPWDLLIDGNFLYVAMAGFHQIWRVDLSTRFAESYSGTGAEAITDGKRNDLEEGGTHAQPSGITGSNGNFYVTDSESSSVRQISGDSLTTLIGTGLFKFGDEDGDLKTAKLQHPVGIALTGERLFIADTFNSKIKLINLQTKKIETFVGGKKAGYQDGKEALFDEPSGLAVLGSQLFVADTNNSKIRVIDLATKEVRTLKISKTLGERRDLGEIEANPSDSSDKVEISFKIPAKHSFNAEAPNQVRSEKGEISKINSPGKVELSEGKYEGEVYYCEDSTKLCLVEKIKFSIKKKFEAKSSHEISIGVGLL